MAHVLMKTSKMPDCLHVEPWEKQNMASGFDEAQCQHNCPAEAQ